MIRTCNGSDPNLKTRDGTVGNCGRTFDDLNHWTVCPHDEFPVNPEAWRLMGREDAATMLGGDTVPIEPGEPATVRGEHGPEVELTMQAGDLVVNTADAGPGPGYHQHNDGSWHRDADDGVPGAPAPEPDSDEARIAAANIRYQAALHAVQSGIAFMMHRNKNLGHPKHLQVGVDSAKVEQAALVHLLVERGLFTVAEYVEAIADHMEAEVRRNEEQLTRMYGAHGTKVTLG